MRGRLSATETISYDLHACMSRYLVSNVMRFLMLGSFRLHFWSLLTLIIELYLFWLLFIAKTLGFGTITCGPFEFWIAP